MSRGRGNTYSRVQWAPKTTDPRHGASGYATPLLAGKPISRPCPRCESAPGHPCRRWTSGRVRGEDIGGGYWRPMKKVHAERRGGAS